MTPQEKAQRGNVTGRPKKPEAELLKTYSIRLTDAEREKLKRLGGRPAVRAWLATAKVSKGARA